MRMRRGENSETRREAEKNSINRRTARDRGSFVTQGCMTSRDRKKQKESIVF